MKQLQKLLLIFLCIYSANVLAENWRYYLHFDDKFGPDYWKTLNIKDSQLVYFYDEDSMYKKDDVIQFKMKLIGQSYLSDSFNQNPNKYSKELWDQYHKNNLPLISKSNPFKKHYNEEDAKLFLSQAIGFEVVLKHKEVKPVSMTATTLINCSKKTVHASKMNLYDDNGRFLNTENNNPNDVKKVQVGSIQEVMIREYCK